MEKGGWDVAIEGKVVLAMVRGVNGEEKKLLEVTETGFLYSFFEC